MTDYTYIGRRFKSLRKLNSYSFRKISEATDIPKSTLHRIENGQEMKLIHFLILCAFYNVRPEKLLKGE